MGIEKMGDFQQEESPLKDFQKKSFNHLLSSIEPICEGRNFVIESREQIKKFVELPLLKACEELYDKNIQTLSSSANEKDIKSGEAYIIINYDTLSDGNKKIAESFAMPTEYDSFNAVKIVIPVNKNTQFEEINQEAMRIADKFEKQAMKWARKYTLEQLKEMYAIPKDDHESDSPSEWEDRFVYNPKDKMFYISKEHLLKSCEDKEN